MRAKRAKVSERSELRCVSKRIWWHTYKRIWWHTYKRIWWHTYKRIWWHTYKRIWWHTYKRIWWHTYKRIWCLGRATLDTHINAFGAWHTYKRGPWKSEQSKNADILDRCPVTTLQQDQGLPNFTNDTDSETSHACVGVWEKRDLNRWSWTHVRHAIIHAVETTKMDQKSCGCTYRREQPETVWIEGTFFELWRWINFDVVLTAVSQYRLMLRTLMLFKGVEQQFRAESRENQHKDSQFFHLLSRNLRGWFAAACASFSNSWMLCVELAKIPSFCVDDVASSCDADIDENELRQSLMRWAGCWRRRCWKLDQDEVEAHTLLAGPTCWARTNEREHKHSPTAESMLRMTAIFQTESSGIRCCSPSPRAKE